MEIAFFHFPQAGDFPWLYHKDVDRIRQVIQGRVIGGELFVVLQVRVECVLFRLTQVLQPGFQKRDFAIYQPVIEGRYLGPFLRVFFSIAPVKIPEKLSH